MNIEVKFWIVVFGLGVATFWIRFSFLYLAGRIRMPDLLERMLRYIPAAVFSSLAIPALLFVRPEAYELHGFDRIGAGLLGLLVAYWTRNVLATITCGMVGLWVLRYVLV